MPWWAWLVLGIGLLGVEMFVIDAQFYLVFIGLSAAVVGLLGLVGVELPNWAQWLVFSALAIVAMLAFRQPPLRNGAKSQRPRRRAPDGRRPRRDTGAPRAGPERSRRVSGSNWTARNVGSAAIEGGREAVITQVDGLTLHVKAE